MEERVEIHTDGGCINNPGPGGYGAVLLYKGRRKELSGGFHRTTNNRMELMAAIVGLEALKRECTVVVHTDSQYLARGMERGRVEKWRMNGWMTDKKRKVKNPDLWQRLLEAASRHEARFVWTKGHAGNPENERCHRLAARAMKERNLSADEAYERG